jgi:hypothetical protein
MAMANANTIINEEMSLEEKLAEIDQAMQNAQDKANKEATNSGQVAAPIDPQDFLMCEGCQ